MKAVRALALGLAAFSPLASAWPKWLPEIDALVVRQNEDAASSAASATEAETARTGAAPTQTTAKATATESNAVKTGNLNTADGTARRTGTVTGTVTGTSKATATFDINDPSGGVKMIEPATAGGAINLYKIGDYVTWKWNYTDLQASPTAIDVLVSCSSLSQTWTLTQNMTFAQPASYTWDTSVQATDPAAPLRNAQYTLVIYDAASSVSATAVPGYLGVSNPLQFGMYSGLPYQNLSDWKCPGCESGASTVDNRALGMALGMSILTVASFTWFVAGAGMI
ncbi:hypothetical protein C8034_v005030 [Colletotrichum sidae]|uniref:DUF7137 domain-containing protein n=1 Tax=Colletotrichum sidae TaxID=1347389 RepID=A0A4R8T7B1_9PEZI|nr:hypothetical protein C8034_v005030 [Colletotrichum sidae]